MTAVEAARVLVVDDDPQVLRVVQTILRRGGIDALAAGGAQDALRIVRTRPGAIDLVLTDVCMPNMDGFELVRQVKEMAPSTRVVFMSGILGSGEIEPGVPFIRKPFAPGVLITRIRELLQAAG